MLCPIHALFDLSTWSYYFHVKDDLECKEYGTHTMFPLHIYGLDVATRNKIKKGRTYFGIILCWHIDVNWQFVVGFVSLVMACDITKTESTYFFQLPDLATTQTTSILVLLYCCWLLWGKEQIVIVYSVTLIAQETIFGIIITQ